MAHKNQIENEILEVITKQPEKLFSDMDIAQLVSIDPPKKLWEYSVTNVKHHLLKLCKEEKIIENNGKFLYLSK